MKEVKKNFNHLLKSGKVYPIMIYPVSYILINKRKYSFDLEKHNLSLDLNGDTVVIARVKDEILILPTINTSPARNYGIIDNLQPFRTLSTLDKTRLDTINGKDKSSKVRELLTIRIDRVIQKILNSSAYKNGKITADFLSINPYMLHPMIKSININTKYSQSEIMYYVSNKIVERPLGMFELYLYRLLNFYMFKIYPPFMAQQSLSSKHFIGTPPVWLGDSVISILNNYEEYYKEIKSIYKMSGILEKLRRDKENKEE